jgi:hypothetical protein
MFLRPLFQLRPQDTLVHRILSTIPRVPATLMTIRLTTMRMIMLRILTLPASIPAVDLDFVDPKMHDCSCYAASPGHECY